MLARMHRSRLAGFIIDCQTGDLQDAASFWSAALGLPITGADGPSYLRLDGSSHDLDIEVQQVAHPSRVHLDVESDDVEAEVAQVWDVSHASPITLDDARRATSRAIAQLDNGFFRVRLDRLTPREKDYMRAMAELGPGPHRSGDIAQALAMDVTTAGPLRNGLIKKGMIFSPQHGDTAFTVPMFDEFMRRSMPEWSPGSAVVTKKKRQKKRGRAR